MPIAIDWDKTYTADAAYWYAVMKLGQERGHEYVIVTEGRSHNQSAVITTVAPLVLFMQMVN